MLMLIMLGLYAGFCICVVLFLKKTNRIKAKSKLSGLIKKNNHNHHLKK